MNASIPNINANTNIYGMHSVLPGSYQSGNHFFDMIMLTIISSVVTTIVSSVTEIHKTLIKMIATLFTNIYDRIIKYRKKDVYEITIENNLKTPDQTINNKLLIEAVLYDYSDAKKYKINNKEIDSNHQNEFTRETNRKLILSVNDVFIEDDITIEHNIITKSVQVKSNDKKEKSDEAVVYEDVPVMEKLNLSTNKSLDHIKNYVQRKKTNYIRDFCSMNNSICIYPVHNYGSGYLEFNKLKFESQKTLDSWFSPHKKNIGKIINDFKNKNGIYKLNSIPYKLSFMLHGEPGCGKTSFIKALANELDRCIIPVFLDKFNSAAALRELFQSDYMMIREKDNFSKWIYLPMNKRLIVFEEIDTAGTIIMDRNKIKELIKIKKKELHRSVGGKNNDETNNKKTDSCGGCEACRHGYPDLCSTKNKSRWISSSYSTRGVTGPNGGQSDEENIIINDMSRYIKYEHKKINNSKKDNSQDDHDDQDDATDMFDDDVFDRFIKHKSGITLGDILDVLDGLCESSGLVYVMTTNHIDFLDPAIIRPGRVTYIAKLEEIKYTEIKDMLTYYYITSNCYNETIPDAEKHNMISDLANKFDGKFNPSKLEEFCKTYTLQDLFSKMNEL